MDVRVGLWRRLSTEELMILNCGVGEDSWESLGLQGDPISPFWRRSALGFLFCLFVYRVFFLLLFFKFYFIFKLYIIVLVLEGMMLKLKLQYFGHLMQRVDSLQRTLMLGGIGGRRRRGRQRMRWLDGIPTRWTWVWVNSRSWWWTGRPGVLQFMGSKRVRHDWATSLSPKKERWKGTSKDIYCSIVCDRINLEITQMLINRR